jgi:hypothetical protein
MLRYSKVFKLQHIYHSIMKNKILHNHENRRLMPVTSKYALVVMLLFCTIGIASAGNDTSIAKIVDMDKIAKSASSILANPNISDKVYLLLGLALVAFLLSVVFSILTGGFIANIGKRSGDNDKYSQGMDGMTTGVKTVIVVVIAFAVVALVLGLM